MMIERHDKLSHVRQCRLLDLARSTYYYQPQSVNDADLVLLRKMDEQYLKTPQQLRHVVFASGNTDGS